MLKEIFRFELRYHLGQPLYYVSMVVFFLAGLGLTSTDLSVAFVNAPAAVARNAPFVIIQMVPILTLLGLFLVTAFVAVAVLRDFEHGTEALFFTRPVSKLEYLGGRFAGSMAISLSVLLAAIVGMAAGTVAPWQDAARIGSFSITPYLFGILVIAIPNLLTMGAFFFALAIWSRRFVVTYLGVVLYIGLQDLVEILARDFTGDFLGGILEPSGLYALEVSARYWTIAEYDVLVPALSGALLANRAAWLAVGLVAFVVGYLRFSTTTPAVARRRSSQAPPSTVSTVSTRVLEAEPHRSFSFSMRCRQLVHQARLETVETIKSPASLISLVLFLLFLIPSSWFLKSFRGIPAPPQTHLMLQAIGAVSSMILMVLLLFLAGERLHRERALKLEGIFDALPLPDWVLLGGKLLSMVMVVGTFLLAGSACTIAIQLGRGWGDLEPGLYAQGLAIIALPLILLAVLFFFLHVAANHKLIGLLIGALVLLARTASRVVGFEDNLYRYAAHPPIPYSDMNGYGHFVKPYLWFGLYWTLGAGILLGFSLLFWVRGTDRGLGTRIRSLRDRWTGPVRWWIALATTAFIATGSFIYYHTHILNEPMTRAKIIERLVSNEKLYQSYAQVELPRIRAMRVQVDIFSRTRRVEIEGSYELENDGLLPIRLLPITLSPRFIEGIFPVYGGVELAGLDPGEHEVIVADEELGFFVYELAEPILPGEKRDLSFAVSVSDPGFHNQKANYLVVGNGTIFTNRSYFPQLGYAQSNQLTDPELRRRNDLPQAKGMSPLEAIASEKRSYIDTDWIRFEAIVSTSSDQIAIAPGSLLEQWQDGDRRYFRYATEAPIVDLVSFMSGNYEVARDSWNGVDLEVYYHRGHAQNIDRFLRAAKLALEYCSNHFGPYPHTQLRIAEMPSYHGELAISLAQTIGISEAWGFVAVIGDQDIDHLTWLTAHEVAHQWWNHKEVPGNVQGATLLSESLSEYSALMVMEKEHGPASVRRFLRYQLDGYLQGRGKEKNEEMPLARVENQAYVHYYKGGLALYALKDYLGEEQLNAALRRFLEAHLFQGPPYPTSRDLLGFLEEAVPPELDHLIEDLFETITLYDNRVLDASYSEQEDGKYRVRMHTASRKTRSDGRGVTTEIPMDDWVEVGIFGREEIDGVEREKVLYLEKRKITEAVLELEITVSEKPHRAGIDPYSKLIDRNSDDNLLDIEKASSR